MYAAILLLPLVGAVIGGFFHRFIGEKMAMVIPTAILFFCCVLSWIAFFTYERATRRSSFSAGSVPASCRPTGRSASTG